VKNRGRVLGPITNIEDRKPPPQQINIKILITKAGDALVPNLQTAELIIEATTMMVRVSSRPK
jgi:hypothetical protein